MAELATRGKRKNGTAVDIRDVMTSYSSWIQHVMKVDSVVMEARQGTFEAGMEAAGRQCRRTLA
jgi:hypothetical protein